MNLRSSEVALSREPGDPQPAASVPPIHPLISLLQLALLAAVATVLRFRCLLRKPFWFDECFSVEVARLPWHDFARLLWWREANMSLYYLMLRAWLHLGHSPFLIRSLSVLIGLATMPALYWLAGQMFSRRVGGIAVALLAVNAYHIRYSQEVRSYALFALLATLSSGCFVTYMRRPSALRRAAYVVVTVLAVYSHLYALLLVAAQWLSLPTWNAPKPPHLRRVWAWIGVAVLPLLVFAAKTGAGPIRWISRPGTHQLLEFGQSMAGNGGLVLLLLYAAACAVALVPQRKSLFDSPATPEIWRHQFLLLWLWFPIVLTVLLSFARPLFLARYFIFCLPALIILAAAGLARLKPWLMAAALTAMVVFSLQGTLSYYDHDFDLGRDASGDAANYILERTQAGDAILFYFAGARIPYEFYKSLREENVSKRSAPPFEPEIVYPRHGEHLDYRDFTGKPDPGLVRSLSGRYPRVWVVLMDNETKAGPDTTTMMLEDTLGKTFEMLQRSEFPQVEVRLYSRQ